MNYTYTGVKIVPVLVHDTNAMVEQTNSIFTTTYSDADHLRLAKCVLWPRSGRPCVPVPFPVHNNKKYPHGAFLDTANCPLPLVHPLCLRQYLQVRGIRLNQKEQPSTLRRLYRRACRLRINPMDLKQWNDYRQRNEYYTATPFTYIQGSRRSTHSAVVACLKRMVVTQEFMVTNLKAPNEVYKRALRRLRDGHIDVNTYSVSQGRRHDTKSTIWILSGEVAASLRNKMHSVRVALTEEGVILSAPYTLCSCEVGALNCAHVISICLSSMHINNCVRLWGLCCGESEPLTASEILSLFPMCVIQAQRIPCRAQHLAVRSTQATCRGRVSRRVVFNSLTGTGETDEETDADSDEDSGRNVPLRLDKLVSAWSCQMLKISDGVGSPTRPRVVSNAHLGSKAMQEDVKKYLQQFPLNRKGQFEQDYIHELEYAAMHRGEIPKNNNWGFYLYKTAGERQERMRSYIRDSGGANLQVMYCYLYLYLLITLLNITTYHR